MLYILKLFRDYITYFAEFHMFLWAHTHFYVPLYLDLFRSLGCTTDSSKKNLLCWEAVAESKWVLDVDTTSVAPTETETDIGAAKATLELFVANSLQ